MINFQEPRLEVGIEQNVKAQYLKAQLILNIVRLARPVQVRNGWLARNQCFNHDVLNLCLDFLHLLEATRSLLLPDIAPYLGDTTLMRRIISILVIRLLVAFMQLINGIIGQMNVHVSHVAIFGRLVRDCRKSSEAFVKQVDLQRRHAVQQHIDAQVKLETVEEVRVLDVLLSNAVILDVHVLESFRQVDTFALRFTLGFYYKHFI